VFRRIPHTDVSCDHPGVLGNVHSDDTEWYATLCLTEALSSRGDQTDD
jgi:hypothetical protein